MYLAQFISLLMTLPMVSGIKSGPLNTSFNDFQESCISFNCKASSSAYAAFYNDLNKYTSRPKSTNYTYTNASSSSATLGKVGGHLASSYFQQAPSLSLDASFSNDVNVPASNANVSSSSASFAEASYLEGQEQKTASATIAGAWPFGEHKFIAAQNGSSVKVDNDQEVADTGGNYKRPPKKKRQPEKALLAFDVLYLRPYQGGTDFAQVANNTDIILAQPSYGETQIPYGTNKGLDFDFDFGYRGTIGYQGKDSRQLLQASYLYYTTHASRSIVLSVDTHRRSHSFPGPVIGRNPQVIVSNYFAITTQGPERFLSIAKSDWNLHYNMMDMTFSKKFAQRGCMSFNPFIGVKGILISENQKYAFQFIDPFTTTQPTEYMRQKIEVKGAGPTIGFGLDWDITKWLSFTGNIGGALLASSVNTTRTSSNALIARVKTTSPTPLLWTGVSNDQIGMPVLDGSFTLRGVYCWKSGRYVDLKLGFEEHYIFRVMKHAIANSDSSTNLSLMGWVGSLGTGF